MKEIQQISSDEAVKQLDEFLKDPEQKKNAQHLAFQILQAIGPKWFSVKGLLKHFKITEEQAKIRLTTLCAFELAVTKINIDKRVYKIDLDHKAQRLMIDQEIKHHEKQISILKQKLVSLG